MEKYGKVWKGLKKCGIVWKVWKSFKKCGKVWKVWKCLKKCEKVWKVWKSLKKCGKVWKSLEKFLSLSLYLSSPDESLVLSYFHRCMKYWLECWNRRNTDVLSLTKVKKWKYAMEKHHTIYNDKYDSVVSFVSSLNKEYQSSIQNIWKHIWKMDIGEKLNKCNQCDFASSQTSNLRRHLKTHSGEKLNKCNQCEFVCSDPNFE